MSRTRRFDSFLLFPLLPPAVLLGARNDAFGFDPPGWLDSFIYLGYFWHYPEHLWVFDDNSNYKISRLPWVLPGAVAHSLFSAVTAARVLAYLALASAAVALYLHVRDAIKDRHAAAFVSVLLACCVGMHAPGGWYYQALPAAGYYLWACWLVTRAASARQRTVAWAAAAGACYAAAVHTHVFLAVFAPLLGLLCWGTLTVEPGERWVRWRTVALAAVAGGVGLTAVLAAVNRATGGEWLFFLPQLEIALKLSKGDPWWLPTNQWLPQATYLVLPIVMTATGLTSGYRLWKTEQRPEGTLVALPCVALALTCVFQFWTRETTLDYDYMAFVLYLHAFPAVATALRNPAAAGAGRTTLLVVAAFMVLGALLFVPTTLPAMMASLAARVGLSPTPAIVPPLLLGLAGVAIARLSPRPARVVIVALWFALVNTWVAPQPQAYGIGTPGTRQEMLETFHEADAFTHQLDPTLIGIKYWMSSEELPTAQGPLHSQQVFDSYVATRAWFTNLFNRKSPASPIAELTREHLTRAPCIGILSSLERQAALAQEMTAHYASLGEPLTVIARRQFQRRDFAFALTVLRSQQRVGNPATRETPCVPDPVESR